MQNEWRGITQGKTKLVIMNSLKNTKNKGIPKTIGDLKEMIKGYEDDVPFGFRNQPIQMLTESDGCVSFQQIETIKFKPSIFSEKAIELEEKAIEIKEYFTINEYMISVDEEVEVKRKLIRVRELVLAINEQIENNKILF